MVHVLWSLLEPVSSRSTSTSVTSGAGAGTGEEMVKNASIAVQRLVVSAKEKLVRLKRAGASWRATSGGTLEGLAISPGNIYTIS